MNLEPPTSGTITFEGRDVTNLTGSVMRKLRRDIQIVFQDPYTSLDPRMTVGDIVGEAFRIHPDAVPRRKRTEQVKELLDLVGLNPEHINRYPHEFSGGQRQRIGIARALSTNPGVLILDEPVSALDVSIQAGVINLLEDLRERLGLSYLFVAHDLAVVRQIADDVAVMYLGVIVEQGPVAEVFNNPRHPYTKALISAAPIPDPAIERGRTRILLNGDLPSPTQEISGCRFRTRCPLYALLDEGAQELCRASDPQLTPHGRSKVACHHADRSELVRDEALAAAS